MELACARANVLPDRARSLVGVLHVINGEHYAGAERVQDHLALRLPEHGFEVAFACLKLDRFAAARRARGADLHDVRMRGRLDLRPVFRLARLVRRGRYAILHTHNPRTALIGALAARLAGVPLVHHVHTHTAVEVRGRLRSRASALVERRSLASAEGLISVSPSVSRYLRSHGYASHRIWTVPNGVPTLGDLPPLSPRPQTWTAGLLALLRPRKGLEVMLEALAGLRAQGTAIRLRAVGRFETSEYEQAMRGRAADLGLTGAVDWVGFRSDVNAELRKMDFFVLPSLLSEGMPMSVLEAMSAGTVVVGTRVDGITDVVRDGEDGILVAPGDAGGLARALAALMESQRDRERIRRCAHRRQAEEFSDDSMALGVARAYDHVLRAGRRAS